MSSAQFYRLIYNRLNNPQKPPHLIVGEQAETGAVQFLQKHGMILQQRNFACTHGEIDAVMNHKSELVFVEIRYRNTQKFGGGIESVSKSKQHRIKKTAEYFLQNNPIQGTHGCRFDVVAVHGKPPHFEFDWIENAFW